MEFDLLHFKEYMTLENILDFLEQYAALGPIPGILLPFMEAFIPIFPLFVFVMANAAAFGLWKGFFYSWLGACAGALLVFFIARRLGQGKLFHLLNRRNQVTKLMDWIERHGFGPLFLMLCFPFTPSALINIVAGLAKVNTIQFILAVLLGKLVMIFTISWIGHDIVSLVKEPLKTVFLGIFIFVLWFVGKKVEAHLQRKGKKEKELGNG